MNNRLNSDGHDESQYLPRNTPPVNAFRAQHGNVRWEGKAIKNLTWLPDILFDREKITQGHLHTAHSFFKILVHAKRTLGICDLRGALFDKQTFGISYETDMFLEIIRALPKPEINMIIWFVCDDYNRGNVQLALHCLGTIQHALENAQNIIDSIREVSNNAFTT